MKEEEIWQLFQQGFDCGQVVFLSAAKTLGLSRKAALRLAAGFGGGMLAGETCGAVVGGIMALGGRYGHCVEGDAEAKQALNQRVANFRAGFCKEMRSTQCREILGFNLGLPEERKQILEKDLMRKLCPKAVATAIRLLGQELGQN